MKAYGTYFQNDPDRPLVYGEVEMRHDYDYGADGALLRATVHAVDEDPQVLVLAAPGDTR